MQPHRIFPQGSGRMEQPRSWGSRSGPASKPARSTPRPRRFWHALFSLPLGPTHELRSVCRLSYCGWPPIHPKFWRGDAPDYEAYVALPCAVQKAASASRGGWWMAREEAGGWSRKRDLCSARGKASDAKSILIMAIQDRSKTAFLILQRADRKHTTRQACSTDGAGLPAIRSFKGECGWGNTYGARSCSSTGCWLWAKIVRHCLWLPYSFTSSSRRGLNNMKLIYWKVCITGSNILHLSELFQRAADFSACMAL